MTVAELLDKIRPFLEASYFVAQIILAGSLVIAIIQVSILKRDIRLRNERAAKEKAIDAASDYLAEFVRLDKAVTVELLKNNMKYYMGEIGDFSRKSINVDDDVKTRISSDHLLPALNKLESIAAHFVTGVADEETGFKIIGRTYCSAVEFKYDVLSIFYDGGVGKSYYSNIVNLYMIWRPRVERLELEKERNLLDARLSGVPMSKPEKPIGT